MSQKQGNRKKVNTWQGSLVGYHSAAVAVCTEDGNNACIFPNGLAELPNGWEWHQRKF